MPVIMSGQGALGSVLFGQPNQETLSYFETVKDRITQKAGSYAQDFLDVGKQMYDSVYSSRALELSRAAINKAGALFEMDIIKELKTMSEFQVAKPMMVRAIMANPVVRARWQENRCEGYGDNYLDFEPGLIGEDHYDYRRIMNGVVQEAGNEMVHRIYLEELREGDVQMSAMEQLDILNTWDNVENMMALAAKDPTSEWNCDL